MTEHKMNIAKIKILKRVLLIIGLTFLFLNNSLLAQRNYLNWPFQKTSIWNMPIHNDAVYVPAQINSTGYVYIDGDALVLTPNAPLTDLVKNNHPWDGQSRCTNDGGVLEQIHIPEDFVVPDGSGNYSAAILEEDGETFIQGQPLVRCVAGDYATINYIMKDPQNFNLKTGDGFEGAHGGSGLSSIGGTIRLGELIMGGAIRHAIKTGLYAVNYYYYNVNDSPRGYRWPATRCDGYANGVYGGTNPKLKVGALLALLPSFNVSSLQTEPGRILAQAFKDYGAYISDDTYWDATQIMGEVSPDGSVEQEFKAEWRYDFEGNQDGNPWLQDVNTIYKALQIVDNNTPNSIGGGPNDDWINRRAPMAPDFGIIAVTGVSISPNSATINFIGETKKLTAIFTPYSATNKNVTWSSSDPSVATVSTSGLVTAVAEGSTTITITTEEGGFTASCEITVSNTTGWIKIENTDDNWVTSGNADFWEDDQNSGGSTWTIWSAGSYIEYTFIGSKVQIYGHKNNESVTGNIFIDNVLVESSVSWNQETDAYQQLIWESTELSNNSHTIKIESNGDYIEVDFLLIYDGTTDTIPEPAKIYQFYLYQNHPNPFNPTTEIFYSLAKTGDVSLKVYDLLGNEVDDLVQYIQSAGLHSVKLESTGLASGVYFYKLESGGLVQTRKMVLSK